MKSGDHHIGKLLKVKRGLALCLALVMMLGFLLACDDEPVLPSDLHFVSSDGYSIYTIVYSEKHATEELIAAVKELRDAMEIVLGCEVALTDDHVSKGTDFAYEILVGNVDRTVIPGLESTLAAQEYTVRVAEHKIVLLGADNRATLSAIEHFMKDVMGCTSAATAQPKPTLGIDPEYLHMGKRMPSDTPVLKTDTVMPVSPYLPTALLLVDVPAQACDSMTLATLQGLAAARSGEQILLNTEDAQRTLNMLTAALPDGYAATVYTTDAQGDTWTLSSLLSYFAPELQGYILCGADLSGESAAVAVSLAHQMKAVVVSEQNRALAEAAGLRCVFDATKATMTWLFASEYFSDINRTVAVEQSAKEAPALIDYAVMSGALLIHYSGDDPYMHAQMFRYLDDGAVVLGKNETLGEYRTLQTLSAVNACYLPAQGLCNLSTISGFARDGITLASILPDVSSAGELLESGKHTVCLLMSNGDDFAWINDDFLMSDGHFGSERRGSFAVNWGIPAVLGELANPTLTALSTGRTGKDEFVVQFSGIGAMFPSLWRDDALGAMAQKLGHMMEAMGVSYLQVTDDAALTAETLAPLAGLDAIKGIFYTDYQNKTMDGSIAWIGETPVMQARYRLCAESHQGGVEYIAESINAASTDHTQDHSYSVVIIDAASGLDAQGHLVAGGNTMNAVAALIAALDENVDVVGADAFVARVKANLAPTLQSGDGNGK